MFPNKVVKQTPEKLTVSHYQIDKKKYIGKGQYGVVYGCTDQNDDSLQLCAKVLQSKDVEQQLLKREIDILKLLMPIQKDNQNLVQVYDILDDKEKGMLYLIMEHCAEGDLKQMMDKRKKSQKWFTVEEATDIVGQIAKGYQTLYQYKIIHRDLKPANILIQNNVYKIADLGMGRIIEDMNYATNFTKVGTPAYAAPQLFLDSKFSSKADVYSLGVIYYQLVYGQLPIEAKTQPELIEKLRNLSTHPIICPEDCQAGPVSKDVRDLIESMLVLEESKRLSWMDVFSAKVLKLNIVHIKQSSQSKTKKLTLSNLKTIKYQDYYRVNEITENSILQIVRILTNKSDLAFKCHKLLQEQKSYNNPLPLTAGQSVLLSVCLSGYRYKMIQNILGLLLNQFHQLIPDIQAMIHEEDLAAFSKVQDENTKYLREYIQKALNQAILMFREDECRFYNQGQGVSLVDTKKLKNILESDDDTNFKFYAKTFETYFKAFSQNLSGPTTQDSSNQDLLVYMNKFSKVEDLYPIHDILKTKPSDILEKTQIIG